MSEKTILITGSTDGIGEQAALELVKLGAHVLIHGRNKKKAELTIKKIENETSLHNMSPVYAELGSFDQINEMVNTISNKYEKLDVLINNAGLIKPERSVTQEGLETTFAVNYVAPFLLTNLLIDLLKKANSSRIVNVASQVQINHLDFDNLQYEVGYTQVKAYALSKTCLIMFTYLLAEKLKNSNITVNCLHPGVINTKILEEAWGAIGASVEVGAKTLIYAAIAPELENVTGKYLKDNKLVRSKDITYNKKLQTKLWQQTEEIIGKKFTLN
jgi:NAD(P)-dependent dehydrogenase (short-subunit alcohol dehydrogenase family)